MIVSGIRCGACGEVLWSRHRHDFRWCGCRASFVDGGRHYMRAGGEAQTVSVETDTGAVVEEAA